MSKARDVIDVILGEATHINRAASYADMLAIASAIANRSTLGRVTAHEVISARDRNGRKQFDAYGRALPAGVKSNRDLAQRAWSHVQQFGPTHRGTYFATPAASKNLPSGLHSVSQTRGHVFYEDPQNRSFLTARGYVTPVPAAANPGERITPAVGPVPTSAPRGGSQDGIPDQSASLPAAAAVPTSRAAAITDPGPMPSQVAALYSSPLGIQGSRVTSDFGPRSSPMGIGSTNHRGIDMTATLGRGQSGYPAMSVAPGVVVSAGRAGGYGNMVEVLHTDGNRSRYGHLGSINVTPGQQIASGHPIGTIGNTGRSTGEHLHFELMDPTGRQINPANVMSFATPAAPTPGSRGQALAAQGYQQAGRSMAGSGLQSVGGFPGGIGVANDEAAMERSQAQALANATAPTGGLFSMAANAAPASQAAAFASAAPTAPHSGPSAREVENLSMASMRSSQPAIEAMLGDRAQTQTQAQPASPAQAPAQAPAGPSPSRPDNLMASGPKGLGGPGGLYVGGPPPDPVAINAYQELGKTMQQAGVLGLSGKQAAPAALPAVPTRSVPALMTPPVQAPVAPPVAPVQAPTAPASPPGFQGIQSVYDAFDGRVPSAVTSAGTTVSRGRDGSTYSYNPEFDITTITTPTGQQGTQRGNAIDQARARSEETVSRGGLLGRTQGILGGLPESFGPGGRGRGLLGGIAGSALGGAVGGPLGAMALGAIGREIAMNGGLRRGLNFELGPRAAPLGKNELAGLLAANYTPGLAFPTALTAPAINWGSGWANGGNGPSLGEMAAISPGAAAAISAGRGGLY